MPRLLERVARSVREYEWFAVVVEIFVIILSLMLAFQLDRWREDRADRKQEHVYIDRLIDDIQSDVPDIEYAIEMQSMRLGLVDLLIARSKSNIRSSFWVQWIKRPTPTRRASPSTHSRTCGRPATCG